MHNMSILCYIYNFISNILYTISKQTNKNLKKSTSRQYCFLYNSNYTIVSRHVAKLLSVNFVILNRINLFCNELSC